MKPKMLENFKDLTRTNSASFKGKSIKLGYTAGHMLVKFDILQLFN